MSISLPALDVRPPQQQDLIGQYGNLMRLKDMQQQQQQQQAEAPLRQQILQNQAQGSGLQLQQQQQALKDQQTAQSVFGDPANADKTIGEILPSLRGKISVPAYQGLLNMDLKARQNIASLSTTELANQKAAHDATQQLYDSVMNMPDEQLTANWAQIAQQYDAIPGNQKQPLNPNQPMTKQQLAQFGPMISMGNAYLDDELKRRKATADTSLAEQNASFGPTGPAADAKYRFIEQKSIAGQPVSPAEKNWAEAYKKQKLLVPVISGQVREAGYASSRLYPVFDNATKQTLYVSAADVNAMRAENPARYSPASYSPESIGQRDTTGYFTKGKGGQQLTAFNTAISHLSTLDTLADALHNSNIQAFNKAAQAWAQQTGNPAPTNFEAAKNAMAGEVASALKASGATDQEIDKVDQTFSRAQSPAQLKGAIGTYRALLKSKAQMLLGQYEQGMQGKPNFQNGTGQPQPNAAASAAPAIGTVEQGYRFKGGNPADKNNWEVVK